MATITINLDDELNEKFRETVRQKIGHGKGTLGKAIEDAIASWIKERSQSEIASEMLNLMKEGIDMGKIKIKKRDELYER